jgi:flagellar biosynthesis protein FlhF
MQVKKFEAPTIQEALETIKRELGPEAIILQTKNHKRGFGLMSKASVEVTAAVSERSMQKKDYVEKRVAERDRDAMRKMPADRQAEYFDKHGEKHLERLQQQASRDRVELQSGPGGARHTGLFGSSKTRTPANAPAPAAAPAKKITSTRYIDIDSQELPTYAAAAPAPRASQAAAAHGPSSGPSGATPGALGFGGGVEEEVRHLKRMIQELKSAQDTFSESRASRGPADPISASASPETLSTPALRDAFEQLVLNGVERRYALPLIKKVSFELGAQGDGHTTSPDAVLDALAGEIMQTAEVLSPMAGILPRAQSGDNSLPAVLSIVGPTGVGKTTTVAKLASEAILKRNLKVGLINLDSYKVAAFDQLGTYAKILNVPFRSCGSSEELQAALKDFQSLDLILVDTAGRSQRDPGSLREMQGMLAGIPMARTMLALSVTTRDAELYDMANRFAIFRPQGLIVSKLDEATAFGAVYNLSQRVKLPLLYFTTGQRVPEDIEDATGERVAALILEL